MVIARELQNRALEANTLNRIGMAYYWMKDHNKAIEAYQQSLIIARETNNQQLEKSILLNLGDTYSELD